MWKEFRDFLKRGNVIDLAVAVAVGGAFGLIVQSLVNDIIMPLVGILLGGLDFTALSLQVGEAVVSYGNFIQAIINFLLIALVLFLVVHYYTKLQRQPEQTPPPPPPEDVLLLREIRDLLQKQQAERPQQL